MASARPFFDVRSLRDIGPLAAPDKLGIRLPQGFQSQIVAQAFQNVRRFDGSETSYKWHMYPDGGACFPTDDGGWIYTSNSEVPVTGGAGAIRFNADGDLVDAYSILSGTNVNCAGGPTPWGSWLSCEEIGLGSVYECDVTGRSKALKRRGLGTFKHEAVAIEPVQHQAYLTEDEPDGCFYRFTPRDVTTSGRMNLDEGRLEVAVVAKTGQVEWVELANPNPALFSTPTRKQIKASTKFDGGEGIWYHEGDIYFTTKGDNRVWRYQVATQELTVYYDKKTASTPILSGVDNVTVTKDGHVLVAEDGDDMQIVVLGPYGDVYPLVQVMNQDHSEITGPAVNPYGDRLYFSSQRGIRNSFGKNVGVTYEIRGRFA
jgi:secreted PhoX family phosphatase